MNLYVKRIIAVVLFLAITLTVLFYTGELYRSRWDDSEDTLARTTFFNNLPEPESLGLIMGSSTLYKGLIPAAIFDEEELTTYNLSGSLNSFFSRYHYLESILDDRDVDYLITDLSMLFSREMLPSSDEFGSFYKRSFNSLSSISRKRDYIKGLKEMDPEVKTLEYWFPFIKHHNNWDELRAETIEHTMDTFTFGANISTDVVPQVEDTLHEETLPLNETEVHYFKKVLALLKEKDITLIVVNPPRSILQPERIEFFKELSMEHDFVFYDYQSAPLADELGISLNTDFYDEAHLNVYGADDLSRDLARRLQEDLGIHTGGNDLRPWIEATESYRSYFEYHDNKRPHDE